jgi:hypothetical protein
MNSEVTGKLASGEVPEMPSGAQRTIPIVGAVFVVVGLPVLLMDALVGEFGAEKPGGVVPELDD